MRFSIRVKLVSILAVFLVMLAGSAWGATYGVRVEPVLDEANTGLTLTFTFYKDGQKINAFESLTGDWIEDFKKYVEPQIRIDGVSNSNMEPSTGSVTYSTGGNVVAKYTLASELAPGGYKIRYQSLWSTDAKNALPQDEEDALAEKYDTFFDEHDTLYGEGNFVNGGQPVAIGITVTEGTGAVTGNDALVAVTEGGKAKVSEIEKADEIASDTIMPLEVFKVSGQVKDSVFIQTYTMSLDTIAAGGHKVGDLVVVKLTKNNGAVKFAKAAPGSVGNGQFSVTTFSGVPNDGDTIQSGIDYIISIGIQDGGAYDWDDGEGIIVDPAAIAANSQGNGDSSGGGCNAGYGIGIMGLLLVGLVTRKSRKA